MRETLVIPLPDPPRTDDAGLRSAQGIRWLLFAGALVAAVSILHLVGSVWSTIPVPLQFLVLSAGALGLFALGNLTRERLRLPHAGSALLALFAALLPILSWGADALELLRNPAGWLAFGLALLGLLAAARQVLRSQIGYAGWLYPAALAVFWLAPHLLLALGAGHHAIAAITLVIIAVFAWIAWRLDDVWERREPARAALIESGLALALLWSFLAGWLQPTETASQLWLVALGIGWRSWRCFRWSSAARASCCAAAGCCG